SALAPALSADPTLSQGAAGSPTRGPGETTRHNAPALATPAPHGSPSRLPPPLPPGVLTPAPVEQMAGRPAVVKLPKIQSIVPAAWLQGQESPPAWRTPTHLVSAVVGAAETESGLKPVSGSVIREAGGWSCRFLSTIDPRVARVKLDLLWEQGGVIMDTRNE